jgi:TPR repeat protein
MSALLKRVSSLLSTAISTATSLRSSHDPPTTELLHDSPADDDDPLSPEDDYFRGKARFDEKDYIEAVKYFTRPAQLGHADAMKYLALCYAPEALNDPDICKEWSAKREEVLKYPEGMFSHAQALRAGGDILEAVSWFRMAADQGHPEAQYQLGVYMRKTENPEAISWFEKAADGPQGHYMAELVGLES